MTENRDRPNAHESSFRIICDLATLHRSRHGAILGDIHVELTGVAFPERKWSDFVVTVLAWWVSATRQLGRGINAVDLMFMEGPFVVRIATTDGATCSIEFLKRSPSTVKLAQSKASLLDVIQEIEQVAAKVAGACSVNRWHSTELDTLRALLDASTGPRRIM